MKKILFSKKLGNTLNTLVYFKPRYHTSERISIPVPEIYPIPTNDVNIKKNLQKAEILNEIENIGIYGKGSG